jgi:hypothetical protein
MSFFEAPPPPPAPRDEPWLAPPDNVLGTAVALNLLLARTDVVAVRVGAAVAYPSGLDFTVSVRRRDPGNEVFDLWSPRRRELPPELLRFGIQFADGSKATTLGAVWSDPQRGDPNPPVLMDHGGGGDDRRWDQEFWLWPLPPPGPLTFVCEWPAYGIAETRHEIDAAAIVDAAAKAKTLWPEQASQDDERTGGVTSYEPGF